MLFGAACRRDSPDVQHVKDEVRNKLHIGGRAEEIVPFFKSMGWVYGYQEWNHSYRARVAIERNEIRVIHGLIVEVILDKDGHITEIKYDDFFE